MMTAQVVGAHFHRYLVVEVEERADLEEAVAQRSLVEVEEQTNPTAEEEVVEEFGLLMGSIGLLRIEKSHIHSP
jgi:hypothetical protein